MDDGDGATLLCIASVPLNVLGVWGVSYNLAKCAFIRQISRNNIVGLAVSAVSLASGLAILHQMEKL